MQCSVSLLQNNRPNGHLLRGILAIMDEERMPCLFYSNSNVQNAYWKGFKQAIEVSNLFVRNFHGELIFAALNYPGSWKDSRIAAESGLYGEILMKQTPIGMAVFAESTFLARHLPKKVN